MTNNSHPASQANPSEVRVRIAPSPTGDPHVGTAYIALFNYVFAKKHGGKFVLRIEDTDQARAKASSESVIMSSMHWMGLTWDEGPDVGGPYGPYRQSERREIYQEHAEILLKSGHAYRCFCSADRLTEMRRQQRMEGLPPAYDRFCRSLSETEITANISLGKPYVLRMKMPTEGVTKFIDELRGPIEFENHRIDDQVLMKSDGYPTYHLANVVDDRLMKITHVIRAEEWISSTPKHVQLYKMFGWPEPKWAHMPLLRNADKSKISKRKNPVSLNYFRRAGYLPEALRNFLALMGWNPGGDVEIFGLQLMQEKFELKDINLGDPVFDTTKLDWMNHHYLQSVSEDKFAQIIREELFSVENLKLIRPLVIERMNKFSDFVSQNDFFFNGTLKYDHVELVPKGLTVDQVHKNISELLDKLDELYTWDAESLKQLIESQRAESGCKPRDYFMPIRMIVTGRADSPPLYESLALIGREMVRHRMRVCLQTVLRPG